MIVVDTNILAYALVPGPETGRAEGVLLRDPAWVAPVLWRSEFRNLLARWVRTGRLGRETASSMERKAGRMVEGRLVDGRGPRILDLALQSGCSAYDCEFVALAEALGVPMVTNDGEVLRKFPGIAVSMEEFGGG